MQMMMLALLSRLGLKAILTKRFDDEFLAHSKLANMHSKTTYDHDWTSYCSQYVPCLVVNVVL